jgi:hypothetical protein
VRMLGLTCGPQRLGGIPISAYHIRNAGSGILNIARVRVVENEMHEKRNMGNIYS